MNTAQLSTEEAAPACEITGQPFRHCPERPHRELVYRPVLPYWMPTGLPPNGSLLNAGAPIAVKTISLSRSAPDIATKSEVQSAVREAIHERRANTKGETLGFDEPPRAPAGNESLNPLKTHPPRCSPLGDVVRTVLNRVSSP